MFVRKKPVTVEAVQWDGSEKCLHEVVGPFIQGDHPDFEHLPKAPDDPHVRNGLGFVPSIGELSIPTLEGTVHASPGDWIIKGVKGEFYPCKPDIFAQTYDILSDQGNLSREKTLDIDSALNAAERINDLKIHGNPETWKLVAKASSQREGWMKSTKAMNIPGGALVQVTTQQRNPDGSYAVAEALAFVPGVVATNSVVGAGLPPIVRLIAGNTD